MGIWICFAALSAFSAKSYCIYCCDYCDPGFFVAPNCVYQIYQIGGYRNDGLLFHVFYASAGKMTLYESAKVQA